MAQQNIEAIYRLSPMQEGILFHTLESAKSGVYFEQYSCILDGAVDASLLERAWNSVAKRHAVLRTLFSWERRDKPLQIVREQVSLPWEHQDWQELSAAEQERRWQSLLRRDRDRGFELTRAPLLRLALIRLAERRFRFLWSFHHLLLDGWSMRLILDEVFQLYQADGEQSAWRLPSVPSYASFIAWLERRDSSQEQAFWTETLRGFSTPTSLAISPTERDVTKRELGAEVQQAQLPEEMSNRLMSLARRERLTLNTTVLGAWALVLSRYSGSNDVVFGTTVSGRPMDLAGAERIAGLFINTLPLRVRVPSGDSMLSWLGEIQAQQLRLRQFEQTPLIAIQRWSEVPAGKPLFETIVVFENFPAQASAKAEGLLKVSEESYVEYSNYPLAILVVPGDRLLLMAVHDPRRFGAAAVTRMLGHLQTVLEELVLHPDQPIAAVSLASQAERTQVLEQWNDTQADFPQDRCIHQLFEAGVERMPDAIALVFENAEITYTALNQRANRLARHLTQHGVDKEVAVPIFLERSTDAIVAILGILKAGGAYVPLDPTFPKERVRYVLEDLASACSTDALSPLILTQERLLERLPDGEYRILCIDRDWPQVARQDDENLDTEVDPTQLAYVIYTSGSTGRPKGVIVSQRSLVNSTCARTQYYLEPLSSYLLLSSLATDSSVAGIFWTLSTGATLVLARGRLEQDLGQLSELIAKRGISHLLCVPSLYLLVLEHGQLEQLAPLNAVIVAGEVCGREVVKRHHDILPKVSLYNEYGPTETTVWATVAKLSRGGDRRVSIGRPIANTTVYILDEERRPVPIGLPGELYLGGVGVARGYLNQPDKTAESFVRNPFRSDPDPRLYKTGDLVRYLEDGNIEFLGRIDNQVKIRGYRVELEEIEQTLARHPTVSETVVVIDQDSDKDAAEDPESLTKELLSLGVENADRLLSEIEGLAADELDQALRVLREPDSGDVGGMQP